MALPSLAFALSLALVQFPPQGATPRPTPPTLQPPAKGETWPTDSRDGRPILLGKASRETILAHRPEFRDFMDRVPLPPELAARWKAVQRPITMVCVFGSWCGDSQREMADLLWLEAVKNPYLEVIHLGVYRDKKLRDGDWPKELPSQPFSHVPTIFFFEQVPGGWKLLGSIVENPPVVGQRMGEALVEMLERG